MKRKIQHLFRFSHKFRNRDEIILRDYLALERTSLSNERTMLSYIRSALYFIVGGVALIKLEGFRKLRILGYISLALALAFALVGIIRFLIMKQRLKRYYNQIERIKKRKIHEKENKAI